MAKRNSVPFCWNCRTALISIHYIEKNGHAYCVPCHEKLFANTCHSCKRLITADSKDISFSEQHWHEACFVCAGCNKNLTGSRFSEKGGQIYCGDCFGKNFSDKCQCCRGIFRPGEKKFEYDGKQYHDSCFCCSSCGVPIGQKSFVPKDGKFVCTDCFEQKFAEKCKMCGGGITTSSVTYNNKNYHRECLVCASCSQPLAGVKFMTKEDKMYCVDCHGKKFSKKCAKCEQPITVSDGSQYITYDARQWHSRCFTCKTCRVNLSGRGFLTHKNDIVCQNPTCSR